MWLSNIIELNEKKKSKIIWIFEIFLLYLYCENNKTVGGQRVKSPHMEWEEGNKMKSK